MRIAMIRKPQPRPNRYMIDQRGYRTPRQQYAIGIALEDWRV